MVRNTAEFALVSRSTFGLVEFYPGVKAERGKKPRGRKLTEDDADIADANGNEEEANGADEDEAGNS